MHRAAPVLKIRQADAANCKNGMDNASVFMVEKVLRRLTTDLR